MRNIDMREIIFTEDASARYHKRTLEKLGGYHGLENSTEAQREALKATENRYDMHNAGTDAREDFAKGKKIRNMSSGEYKTYSGSTTHGRRLKKDQKESATYHTNSGHLGKLHGQMIKATNKGDPEAIKKAQQNLEDFDKKTGFAMYDFNDRKPGV